jgi:predicted homoserine dehydrogenase-like protein
MQYRHKLAELAVKQGRPFRIALVGAGQMGRGFAAQAHRLGLSVAAVADIAPERINQAFHDLGHPAPTISSDVADLNKRIAAGQPVGTTDAAIIPQLCKAPVQWQVPDPWFCS